MNEEEEPKVHVACFESNLARVEIVPTEEPLKHDVLRLVEVLLRSL